MEVVSSVVGLILANEHTNKSERLRALALSHKAPIRFVMTVRQSVRLFACISAAHIGRMFVELDIPDLYGNLLRKSKFGKNQIKISCTLRQDLRVFFFLPGGSTSPAKRFLRVKLY